MKEQCRRCGGFGHFVRMCERVKNTNSRGNGNFRGNSSSSQRGGMRRINIIDRDNSQSDSSTDGEVGNMVLQVGENGTPPFVLKGKINNENFSTVIDS